MLGKVSIVGAGPGPAELLTLRAVRLLRAADVVLHDDLVSSEVLALCSRSARVVNVGKRCGRHRGPQHAPVLGVMGWRHRGPQHASVSGVVGWRLGFSQPQINELMIEHARRGRAVVRLKSGDPSVFGRLGEELDALREADIPFEIVPGVTAAVAAAAVAELTLTDRRSASALLVLSAHHATQNVSLPALADLERTTFAVYMPGPDYGKTARDLLQAGIDAGTPCVVVSNACSPGQQIHAFSLGNLESAHGIPAPAVLIIGRVAQGQANDDEGAALSGHERVTGAVTAMECPAQPSFPFSHPSS